MNPRREGPRVGKATILCIDSYAALLPTVKLLLSSAGHEVLTASTVAAGLALLSSNSVDLVILDYGLCLHEHHGKNCIAERIRAIREGVKFVVWCADDSVCREEPPCAHLKFVKPVVPAELLAQIDKLLGSA